MNVDKYINETISLLETSSNTTTYLLNIYMDIKYKYNILIWISIFLVIVIIILIIVLSIILLG